MQNEGALSESGDKWVHKESGYTLKSIEFDTNFGVDNDGNMIQQNEVLPEDFDETDIIEDEDEYDEALFAIGIYDNPTIKFEKKIILNDYQKGMMNIMLSLCEIFGIKVKAEDSKERMIKEIYNIYLSYSRTSRDKTKLQPFICQVYSIMCFLLCYVQINNIKVKRHSLIVRVHLQDSQLKMKQKLMVSSVWLVLSNNWQNRHHMMYSKVKHKKKLRMKS